MLKDVTRDLFNRVTGITAVCRADYSWNHGRGRGLEIGKTYLVSHIGVYRSSSEVMLNGFGQTRFNAACFDFYEGGKPLEISKDLRFLAPYLRNYLRESSFFPQQMEYETIPNHLRRLETEYGIKILLAVEAGSRAMGIESPASDWDVQFVYVHTPDWYEHLQGTDFIEHVFMDDVDVFGWDLMTILALLGDGDPTLLEWLGSSKVFLSNDAFVNRLHALKHRLFQPFGAMRHYLDAYCEANDRSLDDDQDPKQVLFYLRGILACNWIERNACPPPMDYMALVQEDESYEVRSFVKTFLDLRKPEGTNKRERKRQERIMSGFMSQSADYARKRAEYYRRQVESAHVSADDGRKELLTAIAREFAFGERADV